MMDSPSRTIFYEVTGTDINEIKSTTTLRTWDVVVAGNLTATTPLRTSDLFFYDAGKGVIRICKIDGQKNIYLLKQHNVTKRWDIVVPGTFRAGGQKEELLLYDKNNGEAKFVEISAQGDLVTFETYDWSDEWDIIVSGQFSGLTYDDLLFYDKDTGHLKIYETELGKLTKKRVDTTVEKGWDSIVTGFFLTSTYTDNIFFYDKEGRGKLFKYLSGELQLIKEYSSLPGNCDIVIPGRFKSTANPANILFYSRDDGLARLFEFKYPTNNLEKFKEHSFPKYLHALTPGNFAGNYLSYTDLLAYGLHNKAVYLNWGGYIDTNFNFSEFFEKELPSLSGSCRNSCMLIPAYRC